MTMMTGLERLMETPGAWLTRTDRIGLLASPSSVDRDLRSSIDLLHAHPDINLVRLFGPEHGIRGDAQAGVEVDDTTDPRTGIPVSSLYRHGGTVDPAIFDGVDVVVIDLQDIGCRFYTYLATANRTAEAANQAGIRVLILDRPNPIAWMGAWGNAVTDASSSLVGLTGLPVAHGSTILEIMRFMARSAGRDRPGGVPMSGWSRVMRWQETGLPWVSPSPNLPTLDTAHLYPGTCWIEGTNLSEGRGTTRPFEIIGAPWIDGYALAADLARRGLEGYAFRPLSFTPTFSKHAGEVCGGVQIHAHPHHHRAIIRFGPQLVAAVHAQIGSAFEWVGSPERRFIDLLGGSAALREAVDNGDDIHRLVQDWTDATASFVERITPDLEYGPIVAQAT